MIAVGSFHRGSEEGTAAVEAAIVIPVLLMLVVGAFEYARILWTYNTMLLAVEEAGHYAMVYDQSVPATCDGQSQASQCPTLSNTALANCSAARAQQVLTTYKTPKVAVSANEDTTASPPTITICASYSVDIIAPQLLPYGPFNLSHQITVPVF